MTDNGFRSKRSNADEQHQPLEKKGYVPKPPDVTPVPPKGGTAVVSWPSAKAPAANSEQTGSKAGP